MSVTLADVARAAKVSTATASYALRNNPQVKPATAKRVLDAAKQLNYTGNIAASSLRQGRSGVIGVAVHDLSLAFSGQLASALSDAAAKHNYQVFIQQTNQQGKRETDALKELQLFCDGTVFFSGHLPPSAIKRFSKRKPMILLDPRNHTNLFDTIFTPGRLGGKLAIDHLASLGRTKPLIIGTNYARPEVLSSRADTSGSRLSGVQKACSQHNIPFGPKNTLGLPNWNAAEAYQAVKKILDAKTWDFDAVFCFADEMAIATMHALRQYGLRVPQDVAVVGFDGIPAGTYTTPTLTTIAIDFQDLAEQSIDLLLQRIEETTPEHHSGAESTPLLPQSLMAHCALRIGESTSMESQHS